MRTRNASNSVFSITCRKRHKKCDEVAPQCGSCVLSDRICVWPGSTPPEQVAEEKASILHAIDPVLIAQSEDRARGSRHENEVSFASPVQSMANAVNAISPSNTVYSDQFTADVASIRWLDLLAADAVHANKGFSRVTSRAASPSGTMSPRTLQAERFPNRTEIRKTLEDESARLNGIEKDSWQLNRDIVLKDFEIPIFRNFVDHASLWVR